MKKTKIFISAGHYPRRTGTQNKNLRLKEHYEAQKVVKLLVAKNDQQSGMDLVEVPPGTLREKLKFITPRETPESCAVEVHFNSCRSRQGEGVECLHYPGSSKGKFLAARLQDALLGVLPFSSRGLRDRGDLYFLSATRSPAVIVEPLFIDNDRAAAYLHYPRAHCLIAGALYAGIKAYVNHFTQTHTKGV